MSTTQHAPLFLSRMLNLCLRRSHRENLAPLLPLELGTYDAVNSRANGISSLVEEDAGIVIELDAGAIAALDGVSGADNDGVSDISSLDFVCGGHTSHT